MPPLPVLGVPGWHPETFRESFYDDGAIRKSATLHGEIERLSNADDLRAAAGVRPQWTPPVTEPMCVPAGEGVRVVVERPRDVGRPAPRLARRSP